jgi:Na+/H+ antiporter NhaD/arsenite permease-like protein
MVPITIRLCSVFEIPTRWILCGALVASNLGGFSTSWGDTPNIIESRVWNLTNYHFSSEIILPNIIILIGLILAIVALTLRDTLRQAPYQRAYHASGLKQELTNTFLDRHLFIVGILALAGFIIFQYNWRKYEVTGGAITILLAIIFERRSNRLKTLQSLDLDLYMTLGSIFVLANAVDRSGIGLFLRAFVELTHAAPWAIAISSYFGTAFTEAASWAAAVAPTTFKANSSHAAAWALGGGICAGSSSLITAASAGIILATESKQFHGHAVKFGTYLNFGLIVSIAMLSFYSFYFTFIF